MSENYFRPCYPGSKNYWSEIEVTSTQYKLNIAPMCFAAWAVSFAIAKPHMQYFMKFWKVEAQ